MKYLFYTVLIGLVIIASNFCYKRLGIHADDILKCNAELVYTFDSGVFQNKVLYFGESSNFTYHDNDPVKKSISQLIGDLNSGDKILTISKGAIHASTYKTFIQRIPEHSTIQTVIVTLNLRSFGINWIESKLETNLSRANILYKTYPPILQKFLLSFKAYDNKEDFQRNKIIAEHYKRDKFKLKSEKYETVAQWDKDVFREGVTDNNGKKDHQKTEVACHFIKNYAFILNENNPRVKDLDEIVEICKTKKIQLAFHLLPENYERARELCGIDLEILMRTNQDFLKKRYGKNTIFIDNFSLLKDSCFIDRDWPTEHYNYYGRKQIAEKINEKLKEK